MSHPRPLGRRKKRILKNKKTRRTTMIMKMKRVTNPNPFNWRSYSK